MKRAVRFRFLFQLWRQFGGLHLEMSQKMGMEEPLPAIEFCRQGFVEGTACARALVGVESGNQKRSFRTLCGGIQNVPAPVCVRTSVSEKTDGGRTVSLVYSTASRQLPY